MSIKPLVEYDDPVLATELEDYIFLNTEEPIAYAKELVENMIHYGGVGLAANQLGDTHRVFCVASNPVLVCFNPVIVDYSEETITLEEGCLTYPGLVVKVTRPKSIKIRYVQPNGDVITQPFTGMTARIMQHEVGHLNGQRFFDVVNWYEREKVKRWFKKRKRKNK